MKNTSGSDAGRAAVFYVHGKGGGAAECERYRPLFPGCEVFGSDYRSFVPWEAGKEIRAAAEELKASYGSVVLIANSIGAFFSMDAGIDGMLREAFFISPIVDMERLIRGMMLRADVTEARLEAEGTIRTGFGEDLSWEYLRYVRGRPVRWNAPTHILYGEKDGLTDFETVRAFAERHGADLTVMENGEHWFHTDEQLRFLDDWIRERKTVRAR